MKLKKIIPLFLAVFVLFSCNKTVTKSKLVGKWKLIYATYSTPNIYETFDGNVWTTPPYQIVYHEYSYTFNKDQTYEIVKIYDDIIFNNGALTTEIERGHWTILGGEEAYGIEENTRILFNVTQDNSNVYSPGFMSYYMTVKNLNKTTLEFDMNNSSDDYYHMWNFKFEKI